MQRNVGNPTALNISRSHSLLSTRTRVSFLSPCRMERARLEALLTDVWSREILPFPGISTRLPSERSVRTSASTVMRKLSVTSIANSLAKRTEGLRQRLSFEDTYRPPMTEMALKNKLQSSWTSHVSDSINVIDSQENPASPTPATRSSWSHDKRGFCTDKFHEATIAAKSWGSLSRKCDRPNLGLRGISK